MYDFKLFNFNSIRTLMAYIAAIQVGISLSYIFTGPIDTFTKIVLILVIIQLVMVAIAFKSGKLKGLDEDMEKKRKLYEEIEESGEEE